MPGPGQGLVVGHHHVPQHRGDKLIEIEQVPLTVRQVPDGAVGQAVHRLAVFRTYQVQLVPGAVAVSPDRAQRPAGGQVAGLMAGDQLVIPGQGAHQLITW